MKEHSRSQLIITAIISAAVGAAVTVVSTKLWDSYFPPKSQIVIKDPPLSPHLGSLREEYAPLVFSVSSYGYVEGRRAGLFGLWTMPPQWVYDLEIANLSQTDIPAVEVTARFPKRVMYFQLGSAKGLRDSNLKEFDKDSPLASARHAGGYRFAVMGLQKGTGRTVRFHLHSEERIPPSDLDIKVTCQEGDFLIITPLQYDKIGWQRSR